MTITSVAVSDMFKISINFVFYLHLNVPRQIVIFAP